MDMPGRSYELWKSYEESTHIAIAADSRSFLAAARAYSALTPVSFNPSRKSPLQVELALEILGVSTISTSTVQGSFECYMELLKVPSHSTEMLWDVQGGNFTGEHFWRRWRTIRSMIDGIAEAAKTHSKLNIIHPR